jgi:predicted ATPase
VRELPTGTVTFLFTDVEGSTRLLHELGDDYQNVLSDHRRVLREAFDRHAGVEVDTQGDAFFVAFSKASDALAAAAEGRAALEPSAVRVRMGVHTGEPLLTEEGYVGIDVHRAARIAAAGHGGQILVSQATRDLAGFDSLRDLGEHRLKDLTAPERIYQLGARDFPRLKTLNQTNLPVQPAPLVGREHELQEVLDLLRSSRLLTLTGPGGLGKTRLALQAAAELVEEFSDGVWFVSLASLTDAELVLPTIASTLGAKHELGGFVGQKSLLLMLDNLEQLLPEAAPKIAELLCAPNLKVLSTSRERLAVASEQEYSVPTLPLEDAIALFTARARQLKPTFEPDEYVTEVVQRLDGLPLAIELAAARVKVLAPKQIAERLGHSLDLLTGGARDAPKRQRTLRATIEWSHELLNAEERELFAHVAVFTGSFDLDAVEAVCTTDLDLLQALIDKGLLRDTSDGRFFVLATIGEYASEQLDRKADAEAVQRRHAEFFLERAECEAPHLEGGPEQAQRLVRLARETENVRTALRFWEQQGDWERLLRLATAFSPVWWLQGHANEGHDWLHKGLRATTADFELRSKAFQMGSFLAYIQNDLEGATALIGEWLDAADAADDRLSRGKALHSLSNVVSAAGDMKRGHALDTESLSLLGEDPYARYPLFGVGYNTLIAGDPQAARILFEQALVLAKKADDALEIANAYGGLGFAALDSRDEQAAIDFFTDCAEVAATFAYDSLLARRSIMGLALLLASRGRCLESARALGCAEGVVEERSEGLGPLGENVRERVLARLRVNIGDATLETARAEGRRLRDGDLMKVVRDLVRSLD